jgi:hypothetical protein
LQDPAKLAQSARRIVQVLEQIGCDVEQAHSWRKCGSAWSRRAARAWRS